MASDNNSFNDGSENSHDATTWNSYLLYTKDSYNSTSDAEQSFNNGSENSHTDSTGVGNLLYSTEAHNSTLDTEQNYLVVFTMYLNLCSLGTILAFGVPFNIMSFAFFFQRCRIKVKCADIYLASLAICDGLLVLSLSLILITPVNLVWLSGCIIADLFVFASAELSALLLTTITIDRFLLIYFPFTFRRMQQPKKAIAVLMAELLFVLAVNFYSFGGRKPIPSDELANVYFEYHCRGRTEAIDWYVYELHFWFDNVIYYFIPSTVLLIFNLLIVFKVASKKKKKTPSTVEASENGRPSKLALHQDQAQTSQAISKYASQLTNLSLVLSISFLLLSTPLVIWRTVIMGGVVTSMSVEVIMLITSLLNILTMLSHSTNFIFYLILIPSLRTDLKNKVSDFKT